MKIFLKLTLVAFLFIASVFGFSPTLAIASSTNGTINPNVDGNYTAKLLSDGSSINFGYFPINNPTKQVHVTSSELTGYMWGETIGWINLNCSNNSSCGSSNFKVSNTSSGVLSGFGFGENAGWVNFGPFVNSPTPSIVIGSTGNFGGYAWSQNYGWIQFDCGVVGACVNTDWRYPSGTSGGTNAGGGTGVIIIPPSTTTGSGTTGNGETGSSTTTTSGGTDTGSDTGTSASGSASSTTSGGFSGGSTESGTSTGGSGSSSSGGDGNSTGGSGLGGSATGSGATGASSGPSGTGSPQGDSGGGCRTETSLIGVAVCSIVESFTFTAGTVKETFIQVSGFLRNNEMDPISKSIGIVGLIAGAFFMLLPILFSNPLSFSEIFLVPYRIWSLVLTLFGLKKRGRPWGTVYDSVTKQPLDPVIVTLLDMQGKEVATSITDMDGRYGFLVPPGRYTITAQKTHYAFPSQKLLGVTRDEIYIDLYLGAVIEVKQEGEVITKNIPMDPEGFDWNEFAKRDQKLLTFYSKRDLWIARIADIFFSVGFTLSTIAVISSQRTYNIVIFCSYILLLVLRETGLKTRPGGKIKLKETGLPLSFGVVRVYTATSNTEVMTRVADMSGTYYCLIQNGAYVVTIEKKNPDETYTVIYKSDPIQVKEGFINRAFEV